MKTGNFIGIELKRGVNYTDSPNLEGFNKADDVSNRLDRPTINNRLGIFLYLIYLNKGIQAHTGDSRGMLTKKELTSCIHPSMSSFMYNFHDK